jgi:hypothetical protein
MADFGYFFLLRWTWVVLLLGIGVSACDTPRSEREQEVRKTQNALSEAERVGGWQLLFDGSSLEGWRGYDYLEVDSIPEGWQVSDGTLHFDGTDEDDDFVALITRETFSNFELTLEWKISEEGDSGVFYRVSRDGDQEFHTGPEFQLTDGRDGHIAQLDSLVRAGACYEMFAPRTNAAREAGEWNSLRLVVEDSHVEHWLNGTRVLAYELGGSVWQERIALSAETGWPDWTQWPEFGTNESGFIGLQDHGDPVWFRNIKIREL